MKNRIFLPSLLTITIATGVAHAQTNFVLQATDGSSSASFNNPANFRTGNTSGGTAVAPTAGNTYQTGAFRIRTEANTASYTFAGSSLEIQAGLGWRVKNTGTNTVNNLILNDSAIVELSQPFFQTGAGAVGTLAGNISLTSGTSVFMAGNSGDGTNHVFTVSSSIGGAGGITTGNSALNVGGAVLANSNGTVILTGDNSFTGGAASNGMAGSKLRLGNTNAVKNSTLTINTSGGLAFSSGIGSFNLGGLSGAQNIALTDTAAAAVTLNIGGGINNNSSTYDGILSGTGGKLTKSGSGTLTLTNANTYTGETTIKAGTLKVNTSTSISSSSSIIVGDAGSAGATLDVTASGITIGATQTLSGTGLVDADSSDIVTVSGTISAGNNGIGTLTFDGGILSFNSFTKFTYGLGTSSDMISLMNGASLALGSAVGFTDFNFTNAGGFGVGTYTLIGGANSFNGSLDATDLAGTVDGLSSNLSMSGNNLVLTVIPEPSSAMLLGGFGALALLRRRRNS